MNLHCRRRQIFLFSLLVFLFFAGLYASCKTLKSVEEIAFIDEEIAFIDMVKVPEGIFTMGTPFDEPTRRENEELKTATMKSFYIGKFQITQEQYHTVMGVNPSSFTANPYEDEIQELRPVEKVNWYDAILFCNRLSILEGLTPVYSIEGQTDPDKWGHAPGSNNSKWNSVECDFEANGYRLPTEIEWEYACRAGTITAFNNDNNFNASEDGYDYEKVEEIAWLKSNSTTGTHQVGLKKPNAWGLYDMHGNLWEWCWEPYVHAYSTNRRGGAETIMTGNFRTVRGGSWDNEVQHLRSGYRNGFIPSYRGRYIGFRVVRGY